MTKEDKLIVYCRDMSCVKNTLGYCEGIKTITQSCDHECLNYESKKPINYGQG